MQKNRNEFQEICVDEKMQMQKKDYNDPIRGTDGTSALSSDMKNSNSNANTLYLEYPVQKNHPSLHH